jgi:prepilin-type N-terminal cleavage/methylation domain-containing protein
MKKEKGFTLVELMIVVAIIGILAAIAIPKFADMLEKSREGATKGNISALKSAISIYYGDNTGVWPTILTANVPGTKDLVPKYMDRIPPVKATAANDQNADAVKGKGPGTLAGAVAGSGDPSSVFPGNQTTAPSLLDAAATADATAPQYKGWRYDNISGNIWVNSSLKDFGGGSYTLFGYE